VRVLEQAGRSADRCQARCEALDAVTLNHLGVEVADAGAIDAEQARLAQAGLAAVNERDTTCCYARQDKFRVTGAPGGERWEIYTVLADTATFWGQDSEQRWDAVQAELDGTPAGRPPRAAAARRPPGQTGDAATGVCCMTRQAL
jgi:hypothetical protein